MHLALRDDAFGIEVWVAGWLAGSWVKESLPILDSFGVQ